MKKVVLSENDLFRIVERVILEREDEVKKAFIIVATPIEKPGKPTMGKMVWGKYKDGSTLFIPYGKYIENNSKPNLYFNIEDAKKDVMKLKIPNTTITIEPLVK